MPIDAPLLRRRCRSGVGMVLTPAKLNLFLEVERRRPDGFHDLTTLMVPIRWQDQLRITALTEGEIDRLEVRGVRVPTGPENLVRRAADALRERYDVPPIDIRLTKRLPVEAGLGGGSANAAGTLVLLDELFDLRVSREDLRTIAADLGSDVPFFLGPGPALCRGRGEIVTGFPKPNAGALFGGVDPLFVVIVPPSGCSTPEIFARIAFPLTSPDGPIRFQDTTFVNSSRWPGGIFNRLETHAIASAGGRASGQLCDSDERDEDSDERGERGRRDFEGVSNDARGNAPGNFTALGEISDWLRGHASRLWPTLRTEGAVRNWAMTGSGSAFFVAARSFVIARRFAERARRELGVHASVHRVLR